jgi:RNA polymerase sigma factor (sigma-70 family)
MCTSQGEGRTDGQLLAQFLEQRDESAFGILLKRHGPMVLGVCRRVLGNTADAEDAFQATFLVLVHKAASLTGRAVLGDFLHGVAQRTALNARRLAARRRKKEAAGARPELQGEASRHEELKDCLDEALRQLPEKYRLPIVLCDLEGKTRQEAAEILGWPEGTVAGRLARGRALLARRVGRRNSALVGSVPAALGSSTLEVATLVAARQTAVGVVSAPVALLVEGVLKNMLLSKLKTVALALLILAFLGVGVTAVVAAGVAWLSLEIPGPDKRKEAGKPGADRNAPVAPAPDKSDTIQVGDILVIRVNAPLPDQPIQGLYQVEPSGKVALGFSYGRVKIQGLSLEEAEVAVKAHLKALLKEPEVSLTRPVPAPGGEGTNPKLEHRLQQLEKEVRALRSAIDELRKKARD